MQPAVVNGCSDLMKEVFGDDRGAHTRTAVGTNAYPLDVSVECDAIIEFEE
jgi:enamine deaminase RidA (YjgF/YER057c/UK114 family)